MTRRQIRTTVLTLEILQPNTSATIMWNISTRKSNKRTRSSTTGGIQCTPYLNYTLDSVKVKLDGEKGWKTEAVVISKSPELRSYAVEIEHGTVAHRNRRHLQAVPESPTPDRQHQNNKGVTQSSEDIAQALPVSQPSPTPSLRPPSSQQHHNRWEWPPKVDR